MPDGSFTYTPDAGFSGLEEITYTITDGNGGTASSKMLIYVGFVDETPPVITVNSDPITLWPPNHKYHTIDLAALDIVVEDAGDADLTSSHVLITSVASDEEEDAHGVGDGRTSDDIRIDEGTCRSVQLRAERDGGADGRVYTLTLKAKDASGNIGETTFDIHVPKDISVSALGVDSGDAYSVTPTACDPETTVLNALVAASASGTAASIEASGEMAAEEVDMSDTFQLFQNYPNPVNPTTTIRFQVGETLPVRLTIYDILGKKVATLVDGVRAKGVHEVMWDGRTSWGSRLAGGVYFYTFEAESYQEARVMTLLK